ncbi:MAG: PorV/PorQ family protein [Candidatus Neomarinimicrobiota bacterium]
MKKLLCLFVTAAVLAPLAGQDDGEFTKGGTSAAQFLKFPVDARSSSLGGTHSGIYGDVASLHWNPAGIAAIDRFALAVSYFDLFVGIKHSFLGFVTKVGGSGAIGISAIVLSSGVIEETTIDEPEGTGAIFSVMNYALGLSYARYMTQWLMLGATVKYVREDLWHETAQAVAVDIGSVLETGIWGMKLGMSVSNLGPDMTLEGQDLLLPLEQPGFTDARGARLKTEAWPLPWRFQAGVAVDIIGGSNQTFSSDVSRVTVLSQYEEVNDAGTRGNFGIEYQWNKMVSIRTGYFSGYDTARLSYGLGGSFSMGTNQLQLDYALVDFARLGYVHQTTLGVKF